MTLIACPECRKEISSQARSCPQCGHPIARAVDEAKPRPGGRNRSGLWGFLTSAVPRGLMVMVTVFVVAGVGGRLVGKLVTAQRLKAVERQAKEAAGRAAEAAERHR